MVISQPPPPSSRLPVTGYKIVHNITESVIVNQTTDTCTCNTFRVDSLEPGVYLFTVLAVNALGDGAETSTLLTVTGLYNTVCMCNYLDKRIFLIYDYFLE